ncbi:MAG TPA: sulfite exporter TauE/SafE family protein [Thermoplasmata archaeon]|nr:sulfite exporter TauE/SafE family protein [Thermoplasmata archaeon]
MELLVFVLLLALAGVFAGLVGSLTGVGGAVIVIPVLVLAFGAPFPIAAGAGLVTVLATSATTGAVYVRRHLTDLRIGMFLEIATVPGALVGASLTVLLVHRDLNDALLVALGGVLLVVFASSLVRLGGPPAGDVVADPRSQALGLSGVYHDERLDRDVPYRAARTNPALGVSFGAGLVSGMFGIGGGVFKVFALEHYLRLPMKVATATSNFMIGVTAAAGAGVLLAAGYVDPYVAAPAAIGTAVGAAAGSRLLPGLRNRTVRYVFLFVIAGLAVETVLRGLGVL